MGSGPVTNGGLFRTSLTPLSLSRLARVWEVNVSIRDVKIHCALLFLLSADAATIAHAAKIQDLVSFELF